MGKGIVKSFLALTLALSVASAPFCCVSAEEDIAPSSPLVITPADSMLNADGCVIIDDFNRPTVSWKSEGARALDSETISATYGGPAAPFEGSRSLYLTGDAVKSLDGSIEQERFVAFTVWSETDTSIVLGVQSQYFEYASTAEIPGGFWSTVVFDLEDEGSILRSSAVKKGSSKYDELTVGPDGAPVFIDCMFAFSDPDRLGSMVSVCGDWHADGGYFDAGGMIFYPGENGELAGTPGIVTGNGRGIEVLFSNHTGDSSMTLTAVNGDGSKSRETVPIKNGDVIQSAVFALPGENIAELRISMGEGGHDGGEYVRFYRFSPVSWLSDGDLPDSRGAIRSCLISRDGRTLSLSGYVDGCDGCVALLYSFSRDESVDAGRRTSLAQTTVRDGEFFFSTEVSADGTAVHRKYAVFVSSPEGNIPVGQPAYVTNPGILSGTSPDFTQRSVKGLGVLSDDYLRYDIGCTSVDINACEIVSAVGGMSYSRGGAVSVLDSAKITALDREMISLYRRGVAVYMKVYVEKTGDPTRDNMLTDDDGNIDADSLRAVCGFLAERYGSDGGVTENLAGITVGSDANVAGGRDFDLCVREYASYYRAVYNTVKAVNRDIGVYIPLSCPWLSPHVSYISGIYPAGAFLRAFDSVISAGGEIPWSVSADIWDEEMPAGCGTAVRYISGSVNALSGGDVSHTLLLCGGKTDADENMTILMTSEYAEAVMLSIAGDDLLIDGVIPYFDPSFGGTLMYSDTASAHLQSYLGEISETLSDLAVLSSAASGRTVFEGEMLYGAPSGISGRAVVYGFDGGSDGFFATDIGTALSAGISVGSESGVISAKFDGIGSWSGIVKKPDAGLDLSVAEFISVRATVGTLPDSESGTQAMVILRSGRDRALYTGSISADGFVDLILDISRLDWRGNITEIGIFIKDDAAETPTLLVSSVDALSLTASDHEIINRVTASREKPEYPLYGILMLGCGALICLSLLAVRQARRSRDRKREEN